MQERCDLNGCVIPGISIEIEFTGKKACPDCWMKVDRQLDELIEYNRLIIMQNRQEKKNGD